MSINQLEIPMGMGVGTCCANASVARGEREQRVDGESGVFVVGGDFLGDLPFVALVGSGAVVRKGLRTGEFMV